MTDYQVIIIGAGLGGLTAAAKLLNNGLTVLLLEQNGFHGGRCYSRNVNGNEFDIGALYIGERADEILRNEFNIHHDITPYKIGIKDNGKIISVPLSRKTVFELRAAGANWLSIFKFFYNVRKLFNPKYFSGTKAAGDLWDSISKIDIVQKMGQVLFGALGVSPYKLPSYYLRMDKDANGTNVGNPVFFSGGNKTVADSLAVYIRSRGGEIRYNEKVTSFKIEKDRCFIKSEKNEYLSSYIISNSGIKSTVLSIGESCDWGSDYISSVKELKMPLMLVCVFITFSSNAEFPEGYGVFFSPGLSSRKEFESLEGGRFPEVSTFGIQIPTNIKRAAGECHRATLQFYYPRANVSPDIVIRHVENILENHINEIIPGLSEKIESYEVYYPERYYKEFGFWPYVFLASPEMGNERFSFETTVPRILCSGDSVLPHRPSAPQAMESGLLCSEIIIKKSGR